MCVCYQSPTEHQGILFGSYWLILNVQLSSPFLHMSNYDWSSGHELNAWFAFGRKQEMSLSSKRHIYICVPCASCMRVSLWPSKLVVEYYTATTLFWLCFIVTQCFLLAHSSAMHTGWWLTTCTGHGDELHTPHSQLLSFQPMSYITICV